MCKLDMTENSTSSEHSPPNCYLNSLNPGPISKPALNGMTAFSDCIFKKSQFVGFNHIYAKLALLDLFIMSFKNLADIR